MKESKYDIDQQVRCKKCNSSNIHWRAQKYTKVNGETVVYKFPSCRDCNSKRVKKKREANRIPFEKRECVYCGEKFIATRNTMKYCSKKCRDKWWNDSRDRVSKEKNCIICGKVFFGIGNHKTCSEECSKERRKYFMTTEYINQHVDIDNLKKYRKKYYNDNKDKIRKHSQKQYLKRKNTLGFKEKRQAYIFKKRREDENYRIYSNIRHRIRTVLRRTNTVKSLKTKVLIGCTITKLKEHLQQTAVDNGYLNFDINNYDGYKYHIDHVMPCVVFDMNNEKDQRKCFNYKNMQILTAKENLKKSTKLVA